jgi:DHA2 family multidrug resistance protein
MTANATISPDAMALWRPKSSPWWIAFTVMSATFMEVLDTSIANVSLPNIAGNLSAGIDESTWVLTSYLVSNAIVLPLSGWLSTLFGRKRLFMICVTLFIGSSLMCGFAPTLGTLVVFRILQGVGGGSLQPLAQAILAESFPPSKRGMAMAIYAMGVVVAPIVGPTVGGWITDNYSWRWIFFINVPVGVVSLMLMSVFLEDPPYLRRRDLKTLKIDYIGLGLLGVGLGALQLVLDKGQREDWLESNFIVITMVISGLALVGGILWELRSKDPMIELHLLKDRNFMGAVITMFLLGFVLYGSMAMLPILLQTLLGYTAMLSGMVLSPGGLVILVALPVVGWLLGRVEPRKLVAVGVLVTSASLFYMAMFNTQIDFWTAVDARLIQGLGLAFLFVPINTMAFYFIAKEKMNYASGLINLARNIGGSCGIAFCVTWLARASQVHQVQLVAHLTPMSPAFRTATHGAAAALMAHGSGAVQASEQATALISGVMQQQASMLAFNEVFFVEGVAFLLLLPLLLMMKKVEPHKPSIPAH